MKFVSNIFKFAEPVQILQLILLASVSGFLFGLIRHEVTVIIGLVAPLITAIFLSLIFKDKRDNEFIRTILITFLISLGMIILVKNWNPYFYAIVNSASIAAYYFCRKFSRLIVYNPINLAIILGFILFPITSFHILIGTFTFSTLSFLVTIVIALFFLMKSQRWPIAAAYMLVVTCWGLFNWLFLKNSFLYWFSPELGFSGIVFISLILINSNPLENINSMLLFGVAVATLKIIFKSHEFFYSAHLSLFIVSTFFNLWTLGKELLALKLTSSHSSK